MPALHLQFILGLYRCRWCWCWEQGCSLSSWRLEVSPREHREKGSWFGAGGGDGPGMGGHRHIHPNPLHSDCGRGMVISPYPGQSQDNVRGTQWDICSFSPLLGDLWFKALRERGEGLSPSPPSYQVVRHCLRSLLLCLGVLRHLFKGASGEGSSSHSYTRSVLRASPLCDWRLSQETCSSAGLTQVLHLLHPSSKICMAPNELKRQLSGVRLDPNSQGTETLPQYMWSPWGPSEERLQAGFWNPRKFKETRLTCRWPLALPKHEMV